MFSLLSCNRKRSRVEVPTPVTSIITSIGKWSGKPKSRALALKYRAAFNTCATFFIPSVLPCIVCQYLTQ